uniref:Phosphatidylinositol-specific phospholipase C X domain-containing protein n=1 Tax=viral metagenome TaxID=1070528 RepID=A0A6C0CNQ7_9ZZZZ
MAEILSAEDFSLNDMYGVFLIAIVIAVLLVWRTMTWLIKILNLKKLNYSLFEYQMPETELQGIGSSSGEKAKLRDYFVFSSFNSCSGGGYHNNFVDERVLEHIIGRGVRLLDFEIFSFDGKPVVAVSDNNNYSEKGTFNHLDLGTVFSSINKMAWSGISPNNSDPLFLQFRIKTKNKNIYDQMAYKVKNHFSNRRWTKHTVSKGNSQMLNNEKITNLMGRVVIICHDDDKTAMLNSSFKDYINLTNGQGTELYRLTKDVINNHNLESLKDTCKRMLTICIPDEMDQGNSINYNNSEYCHKQGIGAVCLGLSNGDIVNDIKAYCNKFNKSSSAFILKPDNLRMWETYVTKDEEQSKSLGMTTEMDPRVKQQVNSGAVDKMMKLPGDM